MAVREDKNQSLSQAEALSKAKRLAKKGRNESAFELYRLILEADPSNKIARKALKKLTPLVASDRSAVDENAGSQPSPKSSLGTGFSKSSEGGSTEPEVLNRVLEMVGKDQFDLAIDLVELYLKEFTDSVSLLNLAGAIHSKLGDHSRALAHLEKAAKLDKGSAEVLCNLGSVQHSLGDHSAAIDSYQRAIGISPGQKVAHFNLANLFRSKGENELAENAYRQAIKIDPTYTVAYNNLGLTLQSQSRLDEAVNCFEKAVELIPSYAEGFQNLAATQLESGDLESSLVSVNRAIKLDSSLDEAFFVKGNVLRELGDFQASADQFYEALKVNPRHSSSLNNLSEVLLKCGKFSESLEAAESAIGINAIELSAPYNNHGAALKEMGRYKEALESYEKAIEVKPDFAESYYNAGIILGNLCRFEEALIHYERAIALEPNHIDANSNKLFTLNYHPTKTAEEIYLNYREFNDRFSKNYRPAWSLKTRDLSADRVLKIGYISPDFRSHSASRFIEPLFDCHDASKVELFAYSGVVKEDSTTSYLRSKTSCWTSTINLDDRSLADKISSDNIDILVDLAGHTSGNRLPMMARYKPAPIQVSFLGYGYTTGIDAIDYFFTDSVCTPVGADHLYAETPWRLSTNYAYRPRDGMGPINRLPAKTNGFITFGSCSRIIRLNYLTIGAWSKILNKVPESKLVIDSADLRFAELRAGIAEKFEACGIDKERLMLGYNSPPWDLLRTVDITLDCFPHNSGLTLLESLYMGIPYVTLTTRPGVGRLGASFLSAVGRNEWITESEEAFVNAAVNLAKDLPALGEIRESLRADIVASAIMDEVAYTSELEAAYRSMWKRFSQEQSQNQVI